MVSVATGNRGKSDLIDRITMARARTAIAALISALCDKPVKYMSVNGITTRQRETCSAKGNCVSVGIIRTYPIPIAKSKLIIQNTTNAAFLLIVQFHPLSFVSDFA